MSDSPIIAVDHLSKHFEVPIKEEGFGSSMRSFFRRKYKTIKAVDDISFSIDEGELVAFIGPNGAGKTTTLKMLSGILYPTSGTVDILGFTPQERKPEYQKKITLVLGQKSQLWWDLPPTDSFLLNKDIYGISDRDYKRTLDDLIDLLDVKEILQTQVRKLSLGQRMKCELIASLLYHPHLLFLDEPTIGLDIVIQKKLRSFFKEYNKKYNTTIILTSHYMNDVKEICNRVIMINHGHKIYDGLIKDLITQYANEKYLTFDFEKEIHEINWKEFGKVIEATPLRVKLAVKRENHAKIAAKILEQFPVDNLDIAEIELEDIIMNFFSAK